MLTPAIVQDADTGRVLMLGWMDDTALAATRESGFVTFFSRSRQRLWRKGETSGNTLKVVEVRTDCDGDALLVRARPAGPTCHLGTESCFGDDVPGGVLDALAATIAARAGAPPAESHTARMLAAGVARIAQKVGEEAVETALAAVGEDDDALVGETADLVYHLLLLLHARGLHFDAVGRALAGRQRPPS